MPKGPSLDPDLKRAAFRVEDHPLSYFDFEGTIPAGEYGGGDVIVWDWGSFEPEATDDPGRVLRDGELKLVLRGDKLHGRFTIVRTRGWDGAGGTRSDRPDRESWLLIKKRDEWAVAGWEAEGHPRSVKTGRTNDQVAAGIAAAGVAGAGRAAAGVAAEPAPGVPVAAMPSFIEPMTATLADSPFSDPDWLFELKWDGYRVQAHVRDGRVALYTRRGLDAAEYFPELAGPPTWIDAREAILDGEVVALNADGELWPAWNKTLVAPYSVRPVAGGPVSAPVAWDELEDPGLRPDRWTLRTILDRLAERGDLFEATLGLEQELPPL